MTHRAAASSRPAPPRRSDTRRCALTIARVAVLGAAVLALSACGSPAPSSGGDTSSSSPTASAKASGTKADCSAQAILSALPRGATMEKFECARVGDTEWAAARVAPGSTVFFLQWNGTGWNAEDSDSVCGSASAGLPAQLMSYCRETSSSSPRPTATRTSSPRTPTAPAAAACTSRAILAALPRGARMQKFNCADVNGKKWAAARVDPGDTVFFLQWDGRRWNAEDSDSICGTASAGLPRSLLSYCK